MSNDDEQCPECDHPVDGHSQGTCYAEGSSCSCSRYNEVHNLESERAVTCMEAMDGCDDPGGFVHAAKTTLDKLVKEGKVDPVIKETAVYKWLWKEEG